MLVMGIVNATPDSFADGGAYDPTAHALRLIREGADWIDIGGESTRPGSKPVPEPIELRRVLPVVEGVRATGFANISIDTRKPSVARAAVAAGAAMWNDIGALREVGAKQACAELGCAVVLMHMLGEPLTMQVTPRYDDIVEEVAGYLADRARAVMAAGVPHDKIWFDPGIGFGKTATHSLDLLAHLERFVAFGFPVLLGASRKRFMRVAAPLAETAADRLGASLAIALHAARSGVAMIRVHDVAQTVQALAMASAIEARRG
jgi:dihydropteroate synthase